MGHLFYGPGRADAHRVAHNSLTLGVGFANFKSAFFFFNFRLCVFFFSSLVACFFIFQFSFRQKKNKTKQKQKTMRTTTHTHVTDPCQNPLRVDLGINRGKYQNPLWHEPGKIPKPALRMAFGTNRGGREGGRKVLR